MVSESADLKLNICKTLYIVLPVTQTCITMKSLDYTNVLVFLSFSELVSSKLFSFPWIIIPFDIFYAQYICLTEQKQLSGKNQKLDKAISNHFFCNIVAVSIFQWNSFYILWPNWHFSIFLAIFEAPLGLQVYLTHANPQGQLGLNLFFFVKKKKNVYVWLILCKKRGVKI